MKRISFAVAVLVLSSLTGCGKEVGRAPLAGEGTADVSASLKAGEVSFWTDLDIEYEGDAALSYKIDLLQGGKTVATAVCDPLGRLPVKTGWVETNLGDAHTRKGSGKMDCKAAVAEGGATTAKVTLAFAKKPAKLQLRKADLVLKQ